MADDISEKLKSILNNPDAMNMFSSLLGGKVKDAAPLSPSTSPNETDTSSGNDLLYNIQAAVSRVNSGNDKRINLLNALKPYMRESRVSNIDRAVKMLKLTQITSILKDL